LVRVDVRGEKWTDRHHKATAVPHVVERLPDQPGTNPLPLVLGVDFGVDEEVPPISEVIDSHAHPVAINLGNISVRRLIIADHYFT
jgi:hypothetical protein